MRKYIWIALIAAVGLAGCSSTPTTEAPVDDRSATAGAGAGSTGAQTGGTTGSGVTGSAVGTGAGANPLRDPNNILSKRSVYFDFDSFVVKDEFRPVVEANAKQLNGDRKKKVVIEGHTDERGGREYNLALGQKRAEAVAKSLTLLGVQDTQVEAVSYGKERPAVTGSDESAWAQNRRAELRDR